MLVGAFQRLTQLNITTKQNDLSIELNRDRAVEVQDWYKTVELVRAKKRGNRRDGKKQQNKGRP